MVLFMNFFVFRKIPTFWPEKYQNSLKTSHKNAFWEMSRNKKLGYAPEDMWSAEPDKTKTRQDQN